MNKAIKEFVASIEKKRQKMNEYRNEKRIGTFKGLEDAIARKKKEIEYASEDR